MKNCLLFLIIVAILLSCARPPWQSIYRRGNINILESVEYAWLWDPPYHGSGLYGRTPKGVTIDFGRVQLQVGALLFLGACILFSRYVFPSTKKKAEEKKQAKQ